jgi:hypothetical protein
MRNVTLAVLVWFALALAAAAQVELPVEEIVARSVQANKANWRVQDQYDYSMKVEQAGHSKTYEVLMLAGSPYHRLVAVDGEPLPSSQDAEQELKLKQTIATRSKETPGQRAKRIAEWERMRKRNEFLIEQLTRAFEFEMKGTRQQDGHEVYVLAATPRQDYRPPNNQAKVLTGMKGELLIDLSSFQWVKAWAEVFRTVSIAGFLARVEPGTRFELRQAPVAPGVWMPTFFSMRATAKVFLFVSKNSEEQDTYFNYRRASTADPSGR